MFKIEHFRNRLDGGSLYNIERVDTVQAGIRDRFDAERHVQLMIQGAASAGRNQEGDYWWCRRTETAEYTDIYAIRREPDLSPRLG